MPYAELEGVDSRFNRDYLQRRDDRKARDLDEQSDERQSRLYVDASTGESETGKSSDIADELYDKAFGND